MTEPLLNPSADGLDRDVNRLIADGNDRTLLDGLARLPELIESMRTDTDEQFDVALPVVNAGAAVAIALRRGKRGVVDAGLDALIAAYRVGDVASDAATDEDIRLWEAAAGALWALGAVAVGAEDWDAVRAIVTREPKEGGYYATWLRHGQVMEARRATDPEDDNVLKLGAHRLRLDPGYGMGDATDEDRLRALAAFDQMALLVVASMAPDERMNFYPSYAKYPTEYVEDYVVELRSPSEMRSAIFPHADEQFRDLLRDANEMAIYQAAQYREAGRDWQYRGFQDPRTWMFIREGGRWEDWPRVS